MMGQQTHLVSMLSCCSLLQPVALARCPRGSTFSYFAQTPARGAKEWRKDTSVSFKGHILDPHTKLLASH